MGARHPFRFLIVLLAGSNRRSRLNSKRASKRDTAHYLKYYQSSLADGRSDSSDQESSTFVKRLSVHSSSSSSEYSSDPNSIYPNITTAAATPKPRRRSIQPSDGGADRRRMAIVEIDSNMPGNPSKPAASKPRYNKRARRGHEPSLTGLALVAPPDAAPKTYTHLTPPPTARHSDDHHRHPHHHHRQFEVVQPDRLSREHTASPSESQQSGVFFDNDTTPITARRPSTSHPPPKHSSPNSSDGADQYLAPYRYPTTPGKRTTPLVTTPDIGQAKAIDIRVAAPVIISLDSTAPLRRKSPTETTSPIPPVLPLFFGPSESSTDSLHEQASFLPPPRAMFAIDSKAPAPPRPPRLNSPAASRSRGDTEAVNKAIQLPPSITAALDAKGPLPSPPTIEVTASDSNASSTSEIQRVRSIHRREGAHPVSYTTISDSDKSTSPTSTHSVAVIQDSGDHQKSSSSPSYSIEQVELCDEGDSDVPDITIVQPIRHTRHGKNESGSDGTLSAPSKRHTFDVLTSEVDGDPAKIFPGRSPSQSPKRFSASLSSSSMSPKFARRSSVGTTHSSRTPSPSLVPLPPPSSRPRIKSLYPPAMFCSEISSKKTSLERCVLYAQKINELYMYDSGLGDWTIETRHRANANRPTIALSALTITPQPRHTSGGSIMSEASFPLRPDASVATDLSIRTQDLIPTAPPNLPYPSLANQYVFPPRSSSSIGTAPSIRSHASSSPSTKSGGFFSSLGRKTSLSSGKRDRGAQLPTSPNQQSTKLVKGPPPPRIVNISSSPSVPGGPRAAPNHRLLRSQTLLPAASKAPSPERGDTFTRLSDGPQSPAVDSSTNPDFPRQVDKLADLLPHADRAVLAGYLRRAGQDMLAIGQYLDDERNGTIQAP